jgi:hypothetical protein
MSAEPSHLSRLTQAARAGVQPLRRLWRGFREALPLRLRCRLKGGLLRLPYQAHDARRNRTWATAASRFLIVRHAGRTPYLQDYFLQFLERKLPEIRRRFELRLLPCSIRDWSPLAVFAPWLQDPAEDWLPVKAWANLRQLEGECDARGIPVINRVGRLSRAVKSVASGLIAAAGARAPRIVAIGDPRRFDPDALGLTFPFLIREDRAHTRPACLVESRQALARLAWSRFRHPAAAEFIDVRSPHDGLYRKYRYVAAGEFGVARHLIVSATWEVRAEGRIRTPATRDEEMAYLDGHDPNHDVLQRVRRALGLELIAFDYSYDTQGQLVVWEANPFPCLSYPAAPGMGYTWPYVERSFAALVAMYLTAAGEELTPRVQALLESRLTSRPALSPAAIPAAANCEELRAA